jgi:type II secretory pathway pseudopilin PulG
MIAISVLLIAVLAALTSQVSSMNLLRATRESNAAMSELTAAMEEVLLEQIDDMPLAANFPAGQPIANYTGRALTNEAIVPTYPGFAGGPVPDPLEIVLTMTWSDWRGRPMSLQLATMKAR